VLLPASELLCAAFPGHADPSFALKRRWDDDVVFRCGSHWVAGLARWLAASYTFWLAGWLAVLPCSCHSCWRWCVSSLVGGKQQSATSCCYCMYAEPSCLTRLTPCMCACMRPCVCVCCRNQTRGEPKATKRFINDTIRNDFHRRFLDRYVR
jgi:hypothetical protein